MTTKRVDDLTAEELNEQVAICQGYGIQKIWVNWYTDKSGVAFILCSDYEPCHNAQQAFEIIEREKISIIYSPKTKEWGATDIHATYPFQHAKTSLIAAMRCFVKSVKGEMVEL